MTWDYPGEGIEHMPAADRLRKIFMGKKVTKVELNKKEHAPNHHGSGPVGHVELSDGTKLSLWGNDGGCACSAGCYPLTELNGCDNIITNVEVEEKPGGDEYARPGCATCGEKWCYEDGHDTGNNGYFKIFVYAENKRINLASFEGSDGNGYYGTGWWLRVEPEDNVDAQSGD